MKTFGVTDCTNQTPSNIFDVKMSKSNTTPHPQNEKIFMKYAQNRRCTSSMCNENFWSNRLHYTRHPKKCCGRTEGRCGPSTRPAFAKATQVTNSRDKKYHKIEKSTCDPLKYTMDSPILIIYYLLLEPQLRSLVWVL